MMNYFIYSFLFTLISCGGSNQKTSVVVPEGAKRHAVVIIIDTLRADAVESANTPTIDRLVGSGAQATRAWSSGTWTAPSVISLMTGMGLREHGWDYPMPAKMRAKGESYPPIPSSMTTIAETLRKSQFTTLGFYANPLLRRELAFDRGFDEWQYSSDEHMTKKLRQRIRTLDPESERYFFYIHLIGPHHPLRPSKQARRRWNVDEGLLSKKRQGLSLKALKPDDSYGIANYGRAYHAVIEDTDVRLGQILKALDPILKDSVLVLTSDHGEMLGEHDQLGHQAWVYEPLTQVPFIAVGAPELPEVVNNAVMPDVLTKSLMVDAEWKINLDQKRPLVSQREGKLALSDDGRFKGIWDADLQVFDLLNDAGENNPLPDMAEVFEQMRLDHETQIVAGEITDGAVEISNEMEDALKSLGYIE